MNDCPTGRLFLRVLRLIYPLMFLLSLSSLSALASNEVAIFYPDSVDPYRSIYQEIIAGSNDESRVKLKEYVLKKDFDSKTISLELENAGINKVIVLGQLGYKLAKELPKSFKVVSGALPISPNGVSGISLISDPAFLFDYLITVAPQVKSIHVAYSRKSQWIIDLAEKAAAAKNLTLKPKRVTSTAEAIEYYNQIFETQSSKTTAIWLPIDKITSHDKITLPIILEKAWSREVVVFSSKPSHAKRGVLFSTYPDNFKLGKQLYLMLIELASTSDSKKFAALQSLQLAVNLRTAAHLGLKYSSEQQQKFELTFPE